MPHDRAIGRRFKLRDLDFLMLVIETGSMGRAAELLNTSQPAVSRAIAALERAVGVPLLQRSRRGVEPTPYGSALARRGLAVFDELGQAVKDIGHLSDPTGGDIEIGASDFVSAGLVTTVIDTLSQHYPRLTFNVLSADAARLAQELRDRKIELFVARIYRSPTDKDIDTSILFDDPFVVVADRRHPFTGRRKMKITDLKNERWALPPPNTPAGDFIHETFRDAGMGDPNVIVSTYLILLRQCLMGTGRFLTVLPKSTERVIGGRFQLKALPVALPAQQSKVVIGMLKGRALSPVAQKFIECASEVASIDLAERPTGQ